MTWDLDGFAFGFRVSRVLRFWGSVKYRDLGLGQGVDVVNFG